MFYPKTNEEKWDIWERWQHSQKITHYDRSEVFQHYLLKRQGRHRHEVSDRLESRFETAEVERYYKYCFGEFVSLLLGDYGDILTYVALLLDIYDLCKGLCRSMIKGDPRCIILLRGLISKERDCSPQELLQEHNFTIYEYPYDRLHAHTVAQYSLSTLIMRLLSNYISSVGLGRKVDSLVCQRAHGESRFSPTSRGISLLPLGLSPYLGVTRETHRKAIIPGTEAISTMRQHRGRQTSGGSFSVPIDSSKIFVCKSCTRVSESVWGNFDSCFDCHLKRICCLCGSRASIISGDGLPRCPEHEEE